MILIHDTIGLVIKWVIYTNNICANICGNLEQLHPYVPVEHTIIDLGRFSSGMTFPLDFGGCLWGFAL